jgi:hypothetical protein
MATQTKEYTTDAKAMPEIKSVSEVEAAVGASFIAGGIGSATLGIALIGTEISSGFKEFLTFNSGVGALSGKSTVAVIAFFLSWIILHNVMRDKNIKLVTSFWIGIALTVVGLILTYPPVFLSFHS